MPDDAPSNWDIIRRLRDVEDDHKALARTHVEDMREINQKLSTAKERGDEKYVRKDVYVEARKFDGAVVADLAKDISDIRNRFSEDDRFRRQVLLGLGVSAIGSVTAIAVAVLTLLAR